MSDHEKFAQVAHQKWDNEQIAHFFERIAHFFAKNERLPMSEFPDPAAKEEISAELEIVVTANIETWNLGIGVQP